MKINRKISLAMGMVLVCAAAAQAQSTDPRTDPMPVLDHGDEQKSVRVDLHFVDRRNVEVRTVEVLRERTRVRAGDPPLLSVRVTDLQGNIIEQFNAWHPQWVFVETEDGGESRILQNDVTGDILFPFVPDAAMVTVTDVALEEKVATVDILAATHGFCRHNRTAPECANVANRAPVCVPGGPYVAECAGATTRVALDGSGSSDPDQDPFTLRWNGPFLEGSASGAKPVVTFSGIGSFSVGLKVTDDFEASSMCAADVDVVDTRLPVISCNNPPKLTPPNGPVTYNATATDVCDASVQAVVTGYDCYAIKPNGQRVDKRGSCHVAMSDGSFTIHGSGGVGTIIEWSVTATDDSGNTGRTICRLDIVNPGQNR
ncbi:MAG TPA: hypothetical protein VF789_06685 [Thermoanaerobaculia bacterium]